MKSMHLPRAALAAVFVVPFVMLLPAKGSDTPAHVDRAAANPPIDFPYALRVRGAQGTAILRVHVTYIGRPDRVEVLHSTGDKDLDNVAAEGVLNWHYVPANANGESVTDWATVRVDFKIDTSAGAAPPAPPTGPARDSMRRGPH